MELVHLNTLRNHLTMNELLLHVHSVLASLKVDLLHLLGMLKLHMLWLLLQLWLAYLLKLCILLHLLGVLHLHLMLQWNIEKSNTDNN